MPQSASPRELELIKKEVVTLGDTMNQERLDRTAEIDQLRLELKAIRKALETLVPSFGETYQGCYDELRQNFNPEAKAS